MPSHDPAMRRRSHRKGREKGCHVYISAEQLRRMGFADDEPPPYYRTWEIAGRGRLVVSLYREP